MTDTVVVINNPVSRLGKLFYNTQAYIDEKTLELQRLSQDEAAAKLDNLQQSDFYTFTDLEILFGKADLTKLGAERYRYTTYARASQLLTYLANSHDQLSPAQLSAIFNRFQLSDSDLIKLFESFPQMVQQLSPETLLGYAKSSKRLARYILSTRGLNQVLSKNKYARTLIYQSHPASLWLCERVFGIETDVEDVHKLRDYLNNDLRAEIPNLEAIDAIITRRKNLEKDRDDLEKRLISLNLFVDAVKTYNNAKTAERKKTAKEWLDSLQLRFPTVRAEVRDINREINATLAVQRTKQREIDTTLPQLKALCKQAQLGKYTLDIFLRRQANAGEVEQSRQNLLDLIKIRPNYMTLIDVRHIAAMFAIVHHEKEADKENTLISILSYLCSDQHTLAQLAEYLTQASRDAAANVIPINEIDSNAFGVITRYIYGEGILFKQEAPNGEQFLSKYPDLGKAIFELHPEHLRKIDWIPDSNCRLNFLHTNRSNFLCEHLLNINVALRDPKERKTFFYNGARDKNKETPLCKLREGIDKLIRNKPAPRNNSEPVVPSGEGSAINSILSEKHHRLLLNAIREDDLRGWINLARVRANDDRNYIESWLDVAPHGHSYNEDVAKTIALDPTLLNALKKSPNFAAIKAKNKYIYIADLIEQQINSYKRWTVSGQKDDFIQAALGHTKQGIHVEEEHPPFDEATLKDCVFWYIANNDDLWQRMLKAKVYNSGWWWWGPSQETINRNLLELKNASPHFSQRVDIIAPNLSLVESSSSSSRNDGAEIGDESKSFMRASSDSRDAPTNGSAHSGTGSAQSSAQASLNNSPRVDEPTAKSSPRLAVPEPQSGQKLSPRHADAPKPIGFDVHMNVVDFADRLLEPREHEQLIKMASYNKGHVRQRYDAEWSAARRGTTANVNAELLKHWSLYETFLTERANQGKIQEDELRVLLQLKLPEGSSAYLSWLTWLENFHRAHADNIGLVYQLFAAGDHDPNLFNNKNYRFYLPLLEAKELRNDELERFYVLDIPEVDQALGRICKPEAKAFLKSKFAHEDRAKVSRRSALFEHLALDSKLDAAARLKFFTAEGKTNSQIVTSAFISLYRQEPDKALKFLRAADQNIITHNLVMFLSVLSTEEHVQSCNLTDDDCLKLYNTGSIVVMEPLFTNKAYFEAITKAKTDYTDDQLDIMLKLIANGCSYILKVNQLRAFLSNRVISLCAQFEDNRLLLVKLFEMPDAQTLFSSGDVTVINALATVDSIIVSHGVIATFSGSEAFRDFVNGGAAATAIKNNNSFATVALGDDNLRKTLFIDNKDSEQCRQQLLELYKRNHPDLTNQLLSLYAHNKIPAFNLQSLTGEDLRDLYFVQGACFAELANSCVFTDDGLRNKILMVLNENQKAEFISHYLLKGDNSFIANFLKSHEDLLPLLNGVPLMTLMHKNIHFARQVLMNGNLRRRLNLTSSHFYYMVNLLNDGDLKQFLSDTPDKQFIGLAFRDAIKKGHADKIELFLNNKLLRNLVDCNIVCNNGEISVETIQNFPWAKAPDGIRLKNLVISRFFERALPEQPDMSSIQKNLGKAEEKLAALNVRLKNAMTQDQSANEINSIKNAIKSTHLTILSYLYELLALVESDDPKKEEFEGKVSEYGNSFKIAFGDLPIESLVKYCLDQTDPSHPYASQVLTLLLHPKEESELNDIRYEELKIMLNDPLLCSFLTPGKIASIANTPEIALYCITHQHVLQVLKIDVYTLITVAKNAALGADNLTIAQNLLALRPIGAVGNDVDNSFKLLRSTLERQKGSSRSSMAGNAGFFGCGVASPSANYPSGRTSQAGSPRDQILMSASPSSSGIKQ